MLRNRYISTVLSFGSVVFLTSCQFLIGIPLSKHANQTQAPTNSTLELQMPENLQVAYEQLTDSELLDSYTIIADTESWYDVLYKDESFREIEEFIALSLQKEQSDELASAYLSRLYKTLGTLPSHDYEHTDADDQQLSVSLALIDQWITQFPNSHIPYIIRGKLQLNHGWEIRGGGYAREVSPEAWSHFQQFLAQAKIDLEQAATMNPQDPNSWALLIDVSKGLSEPKRIWEEYFQQGLEANPHHIAVWGAKALILSPKWQGNRSRMLAVSREVTRLSQKAKKPLLGVVPLGIYRELASIEAGYSGQPDIWEATKNLYTQIFLAYPDHHRMHFYYAYDAHLAQEFAAAAEQFEIIDAKWTSGTPWKNLKTFHIFRAQTFYTVARAAYIEGRYQEAESLATQSVEIFPTASTYLILAGIQGNFHRDMPKTIEYSRQAPRY